VKEAIPADGVVELPKLYCTLPAEVSPGGYQLVLTLKQGAKTLSEILIPSRCGVDLLSLEDGKLSQNVASPAVKAAEKRFPVSSERSEGSLHL